MIMPHPYKSNTWIIHYKMMEDGVVTIQSSDYVGPLKNALKHEKTLRSISKNSLTKETVASILAGKEID